MKEGRDVMKSRWLSQAVVLALTIVLGVLVMPAPRASAQAQVTLKFIGSEAEPLNSTQDRIFAAFQQKYPNIKVQVERVPFRELFRRIAISVASADPADVLYADGPLVASYAFHGVIQPLDKWFTKAEKDLFVPASLEEGSFQGKFYAAPERQSAVAIFYNTKMMADAGIRPPRTLKDAWTWPDALEVARKLTKDLNGDGVPDIWGLTWERFKNLMYAVSPIHRSNGAKGSPTWLGIAPNGRTVSGALDSAETIEALQFFQDMHTRWKVTPQVETPDMWENGRSAMVVFTDSMFGKLARLYPDFQDYGVTPMPYFKTGFTHTGSLHFAIAAKSRNPNEAALLVKFMSLEGAKMSFDGIQQLPAVRRLYSILPQYMSYPQNIFNKELLEWGVPRPKTVAFREYEEILSQALRDISLGANVRDRMRLVVERINTELAKYFR